MVVDELENALNALQRGDVIAFQTETFFGLGADPRSTQAIEKLLALKHRDARHGMPLIIDCSERIEGWIVDEGELCARMRRALTKLFWPGPLTIVFQLNSRGLSFFSPLVLGPGSSVAVRVSSEPVSRELAAALEGAITSTSANISGEAPTQSTDEVRKWFENTLIVNASQAREVGGTHEMPSTILDVRNYPFKLLRVGAIGRDELKEKFEIE